jgi:hypothetical protein
MPLYTFLHNLLNVLVQIASKMDYKKKNLCTVYVLCRKGWPSLPVHLQKKRWMVSDDTRSGHEAIKGYFKLIICV